MSAEAVVPHAVSVASCGCIVGESLVWDDRRGLLLWVDMLGRAIHAYDPATTRHTVWDTPEIVTSIGMRADGGYIVGLRKRVTLWEPGSPFRAFAEPEADLPDNRLNEGVVGPDGCFWVGTMQDNVAPDGTSRAQTAKTGRVWRITPEGAVLPLCEDHFGLTNTIAWPEPGRVVIGDTGENTLYSYTWSAGQRALRNRRVFFGPHEAGLPDGSCVDARGCLWNCRVVGGARVLCIDGEGVERAHVTTPCTWPTSCVFGGAALDTLYIASARFTMSADHLESAPWEGNLFACRETGRTGRLHHRFGTVSPP